MTISSKTAGRLAILSLVLSVLFFVVSWLIGRWSGFFAISAVSWLIGSAALIWFVLSLQFYQRALAEQEKLDIGQLADDQKGSAIFQPRGEKSQLFAVAQKRLQLFEKWFIPLFSVIIAVYQIALALLLLKAKSATTYVEPQKPLLCAIFMMGIAFISFLVSRYATGMSAQLKWKPLRAGGSSLLGAAVMCFILAIALAFVQFKILFFINIAGYVIPALLFVLGLETALNTVLDIYRPRMKGQYSRAAFDSRLLGIINEPGEIIHTAAGAIDYQFGFRVSQTWFYKLLAKAIMPLILFAALTLYLLSCFIVINPNEQAVIEQFGRPLRTLGPGLHAKWPWPIDITYKFPTKVVSELSIGYVPKVDEKGNKVPLPRLWGKSHYEQEYDLLVASEQSDGQAASDTVPVSLVVAAVPVHYRIKDLHAFLYNNNESEKLLEAICYRELTNFAASSTIEVGDSIDTKRSLLGAGRAEARRTLTDRIQNAADREKLGVEIVFLGLQGIHPSPDVAPSYQQVVGAVQKKQALILSADAEKNKILSTLAGSVEEADRLYDLVVQHQLAKEQKNQSQIDEFEEKLDTAFTEAKGDIFGKLREAKSSAFEKTTIAKATGLRFASQLRAYRAAKDFYKKQQRLMILEDSMNKIRKYLVVADPNDYQIYEIDLQEKLTPSLYELGGFEETSGK